MAHSQSMATTKDDSVYIVDGSRSPFLKARGPGPFSAAELALAAARPLMLRQPFPAERLNEVILGCVNPAPDEANIARVVSLRLGAGAQTPAWTVQRNCASGLQAIDSARESILSGRADLVLAGGVETMSRAPLLWKPGLARWLADWRQARSWPAKLQTLTRLRWRDLAPDIALLKGLSDQTTGLSMGQTAEKIAARFGIDREQMDRYAMRSHQRLDAAAKAGLLDEIETVFDFRGRVFDHDDGVRPDSSLEKLARLKPVFDRRFGQVTAGNSAQITDGAAWVILANAAVVREFDLPLLGRIVDSQWAGLDPTEMGLGPVHAATPMLIRRQLGLADIDFWEINEAFAAQVLACLAAWKDAAWCREHFGLDSAMGEIDQDRLNVDGGGISLGHPVGASGARIVLHLLKILQRHNAQRGIATLCIGGGQGGAMLLERVGT